MANAHNSQVTMNRRTSSDRRTEQDRRKQDIPVANDRRAKQRRKVPRRRQIDPTTCERDYTSDEIEFMHAMDAYKRSSGRMFPTCSEILEVIRKLGYTKVLTWCVPSDQVGEAQAVISTGSTPLPAIAGR